MCKLAVGSPQSAGDGVRVVAELHVGDLSRVAVEGEVLEADLRRRERGLRADRDGVSLRVLVYYVQGQRRRYADAAALPDREVVVAVVRAEAVALFVTDLARLVAERTVTREERARVRAGQEAEVLALGLLRHGQLVAPRDRTRVVLALELAERKPDAAERLRLQPGEHVGLVLAAIHRGTDERAVRVPRDSGVVTRREARGAEVLRQREHRVEAHDAVAANARVRRAPGRMLADEVVDDRAAEAVTHVEGEVRDAHPVRECPRDGDGLRRAAASGAVRGGVVPELERDRENLVPGVEGELCGHRAVHAPAHRHEGALGRDGRAGRERRAAERLVQRVRRECGGVHAAGGQAAERIGDPFRADEPGAGEPRVADELDGRAAGCADGGAAARVEAGIHDAPALEVDGDAELVAAGGSTGAPLVRVRARTPARGVQMVVERREVEHAPSLVGGLPRSGWLPAPTRRGSAPA